MAIVLPTNSDTERYNHQESVGPLLFTPRPSPTLGTLLGTYYADATDAGPTDSSARWSNDSNAFDGTDSTVATLDDVTGANTVLSGEGTTAPTSGSPIGNVTVRLRRNVDGAGLAWSDEWLLDHPSGGWTWQKVNDLAVEYFFQGTVDVLWINVDEDSVGGTALFSNSDPTLRDDITSSLDVAKIEFKVYGVPTTEDYYVIYAAKDDFASGFTTPTGWNLWFHFADGGGDNCTVAGYYIKESAAKFATVLSVSGADSGEEKNGVIITVEGADQTTFEDVAPVTNSHQNTDAPDPAQLGSSTTDDAVVIAITANRTDSEGLVGVAGPVWQMSGPSGYTIERQATPDGTGDRTNAEGAPGVNVFGFGAGDSQLAWAWKLIPTGLQEDPGAFAGFDNTRDHKIVTMAIRVAPSGTVHTETPTEAVGVTDSTPIKQGKAVDEPVGVTDDTTRVHTAERIVTEPVGVTDQVELAQGKEVTEAVGVTDAVEVRITKQRPVVEPVGVTDQVEPVHAHRVTISESVGVTDDTTRVHDAQREITEAVGVGDSTPIKQGKRITEAVGVADSTLDALSGDAVEVVTDLVGVTDSTERQIDAARPIVEPVGISDTVLPARTIRVTITESIGVTDQITLTQGKVVEESVGITDETTVVEGGDKFETATEPVGVTDTTLRKVGVGRVVSELVGVSDELASKVDAARTVTEPVGITDTVLPARTIRVEITESVGVGDVTAPAKTARVVVIEAVGVSDVVARQVEWKRSVTEAVGAADVIARDLDYVRTVVEGIGVTDLVTDDLVAEAVGARVVAASVVARSRVAVTARSRINVAARSRVGVVNRQRSEMTDRDRVTSKP